MIKPTIAIIAIASLSACAGEGLDRAFEYEASVTRVQSDGRNYRVLEHKTDDFVMVTPSNVDTAASGLVLGAGLPSITEFEAAARVHLNNTNRGSCNIVSRGLVVPPQYEFGYVC